MIVPCNFRPSTFANSFAPFLIRSESVVFRDRYIYDKGIRTIYNSPADNEGEKVENKTGANIFLYTINASYFLHFLFTERIGAREKGRSEKQESPY